MFHRAAWLGSRAELESTGERMANAEYREVPVSALPVQWTHRRGRPSFAVVRSYPTGLVANVHGPSARSCDDLADAMDAGGICESQAIRRCGEIDNRVLVSTVRAAGVLAPAALASRCRPPLVVQLSSQRVLSQ